MRKEISVFIDTKLGEKHPSWGDLAALLRESSWPRVLCYVAPHCICPLPIFVMKEVAGKQVPDYTKPLGHRHYLLGAIDE